jgi:hypothetical protein
MDSFLLANAETVVARARTGDPEALSALYRAFEVPVYNLSRRICRTAEDAEDIWHVFQAGPLRRHPDDELVHDALPRLRVARLLAGYRGRPPADLAALVDLVVAVGEFALAHPEVRELDLNPVLAHASGVAVLDARVVLVPAYR